MRTSIAPTSSTHLEEDLEEETAVCTRLRQLLDKTSTRQGIFISKIDAKSSPLKMIASDKEASKEEEDESDYMGQSSVSEMSASASESTIQYQLKNSKLINTKSSRSLKVNLSIASVCQKSGSLGSPDYYPSPLSRNPFLLPIIY